MAINNQETSSLSVLTIAYFFLIFFKVNNLASSVINLDMSTWYMGILGFIVPVGIAHLMAVGTHKIFKFIKPSFEFGLESVTSGLIEKIYAYGLYTLIILDFIIFYNTVIY